MTQPTSTGRPRSFDEEHAVERALDIFWRNGYRAATTRALEDSLGLGPSSMYNAFGSKGELFAAVLDRYEKLTAEALILPLEEASDGIAAIERFFQDLSEWITGEGRAGCLIINLMAEDGGADQGITARTRAYRTRVREALRLALERAGRLGEIGNHHATERAGLLFGQVLALNISARGAASTAEIDTLLGGVHHSLQSWRTK